MRDRLVFYVNGERREVCGRAAGLTLSDYLRGSCRLSGTKIACAEGDCGACTVLVGEPEEGRLVYRSIDACIAFVYQMDRRHVVTVEGLGDDGVLTGVQSAMVGHHGSQCGFCTPGFVMAMHGVLEEHQADLSEDDWRLGLSGNLCRCTGYRQILDAASECSGRRGSSIGDRFEDASILADFVGLGDDPVCVSSRPASDANGHAVDEVEVLIPTSLSDLLKQRASYPEAKLVAGATDVGVQHNHGKINPRSVLVTTRVAELHRLEVVDEELVIGAAVPWTRIEEFAERRLPEYHKILTRFGSPQVRHAGTLAGNLANASPIADSIPLHYVTESIIEVASVNGVREIEIASFFRGYKELDLRANELITSVRTPLPSDGARLKLYKISKRRDMDISTVTLAVLLRTIDDQIVEARLAAGGVGPTVLRLSKAEEFLKDSHFGFDSLCAAGRVAAEEITPITDVRGGADYRRLLVENLFVKCWHDLRNEPQSSVTA